MKRFPLILFLVLCFLPSFAKNDLNPGTFVYADIRNNTPSPRLAYPVVLSFDSVIAHFKHYNGQPIGAFIGNKQIDLQADDLNHDGKTDELVFLIDLKPGKSERVMLRMLPPAFKQQNFEKQVYAYLAHRVKYEDGRQLITPDTMITSTANDMYNSVALHGMVFESGPIAYRVYFNNKSTTDIYTKVKPNLEIAQTQWHTTLAEQQSKLLGGDVLLVGNSVGVGTFREWDGFYAKHTDNFARRTQRVITTGNLRNVVELEVQGWQVANKTIDAKIRYTQFAQHSDVQVDVYLSPNAQGLTFCSGVQKFPENTSYYAPVGKPLIAIWGTGYPEKDSVKYNMKQTVGLSFVADKPYNLGEVEDFDNHLFILTPDADNHIRYYFNAQSLRQQDAAKTPDAFFKSSDSWMQQILAPLKVTLSNQ